MEEVSMHLSGVHLGPADPIKSFPEVGTLDERKEGRYASHPQYLVCCRAKFRPSGILHADDGDCIMAIKESPLHRERDLDRHRLYVFDNMAKYIRDFVSPLFLGSFKCISFSTAIDFEEAAYNVEEFVDNDEENMRPNAVILNVGLHEFTKNNEEITAGFNELVKLTDNGKADIRYILHSATAVRENHCDLSVCKRGEIEGYNTLIKSLIPQWNRMGAYLDMFNYTESLGTFKPWSNNCMEAKIASRDCSCKRDDGVHFTRVCNYAPLVSQWDFNWLLYLHRIEVDSL